MKDLNVFVGRQPIFDKKGNIYAYELLYRSSKENKFPKDIDPERATIELLNHTFLTIGIDKLSGEKQSFINFPEKLIEQNVVDQLNPRLVVIELLEDAKITPHLISQLARLRKKGFKIALDDFCLKDEPEFIDELFRITHIVKVDFLNTSPSERRAIEALVKRYTHITLLAEKVETQIHYEEALKNGYLLFQGYYFARPQVIKGKEIPHNYMLHFQLINEFNAEIPDIQKISELFMHDVSLSYKLLRYINSLTFDIPNKISSINQAIMLMGLQEAKRWLKVLLLRDMGIGSGRGREEALINRSLVRAKICELAAQHKRILHSDSYFLTGLFSLIDVIMHTNMEDILPQLSLSTEINNTLLGEETEYTPYLKLAIALENFNLKKIKKYREKLHINENILSRLSREAHRWATTFD